MKYLTLSILCLFLAVPGFAEKPAEEPNPEVFKGFDDIANHYKCYMVQPLLNQQFPPVDLIDQFKQSSAQVLRPRYLCNPVNKNGTPIVDPDLHYVCFEIIQQVAPPLPDVRTSNQFGSQLLRPIEAELLCLPSQKTHI